MKGEYVLTRTNLSVEKGETVHDQLYVELRRALMSGKFKPGHSLSIRHLVEKYGVSATPARETIKRLQAERALVIGQNRVPTVPLPTLDSIKELREVRMSLEGLATEKAAALISTEEIAQLEVHYESMTSAISSGANDLYLSSNWDFHRTIYKAAKSDLILDIIETLWMRTGPLVSSALVAENHTEQSMGHHKRALMGLKKHDHIAARAAVEADIGMAAADMMERLYP